VPVILYRDRDGDGFGGTTEGDLEFGCPPLEGYSTVTGDCHDVQPSELDPADQVFPGQEQYFGSAYPTANGLSFDYDCSGNEVAEPHPDFVAAPTDCEQRQSCAGLDSGYLPAAPRAGQNVNVLCGSLNSVVCTASVSGCGLFNVSGLAFRCH
jgi:hypothetical protein